ncbi:hypothetical protein RJ640_019677 [Escallonia rubra]|uniref:Beta-carotene isomerase D27-like C-terminal domain-containing protein n=1 Tax=Escallonia rubra TaxID=112253 RepID=A0AA88RIC4_9ASTE|nr:hypothetical protein RJ640_019677 [Escallonia rubra]
MEAKLFLQNKSPFSPQASLPRYMHKPKHYPLVLAVLTRPTDNVERSLTATTPTKTVYSDNWFDRLAIHHLSQSVQDAIGLRNSKSGYESLVEAATVASRNFNPAEQRELVGQALQRAFPKTIFSVAREVIYCSLYKVKESEFNGRREKNVVYIKKCRFLEETNCVGMCTNLCKMPSQTFIKNSLGTPVNMVPSKYHMIATPSMSMAVNI